MNKIWVDCDRATVKRRYDRLAKFIPLFDRLLFLPAGLRREAVASLRLRTGERVLELGCGTGIGLSYLFDIAPAPLDGVLFCLSYNTMPHHRSVLRRAWNALRPGGHLVIMDARLPSGPFAKWLLPFGLWLMKHTMLGNPLIQPWRELATVCENPDMTEYLFGAYYICRAVKPVVEAAAADSDAWFAETAVDAAHRIAAE